MIRCQGCKYLLKQAYGYSNWSVTDEEFICLKKANPYMPIMDMYLLEDREVNAIKFAETCPQFVAGESLYLDVEGEIDWKTLAGDDTELQELVNILKGDSDANP